MSGAADALMGIFGFKRVEGEMSKSVEDVRRAAFEAAYLKKYFYPAERWSLVPEKYRTQHADIAWWAFNAALDAVEIQLPTPIGDDHGGCIRDAATHDSAVSECRAAIEQTGLGLRVL